MAEALTDTSGRFRIPAAESGRVLVRVFKAGYRDLVCGPIFVAPGAPFDLGSITLVPYAPASADR